MVSSASTAPTPTVVTLAQAAEELGVHYMTAYRYVRTGRMLAEKRSGKWWVKREDLAAVVAEGTGARRRTVSTGVSAADSREMPVDPFTARLIAGDTAGCWDLISAALAGGATPAEVHNGLLQAALSKIGLGWQTGELSIADEHRATATVYRLIGQMGPLFRHRGRRRGTVVVGAVAGDSHALPSALLADLLCDRRFEVVDLGANTPAHCFTEVASGLDDLVGIGICAVVDVAVGPLIDQAIQLRAEFPGTTIVLGGPALQRLDPHAIGDPTIDSSLTADEACNTFDAAVAP